MSEDLVMRSVYVRPGEDASLRQLAFANNVTKSDLIRSAIRLKLEEWLADNSGQKLKDDVQAGLRESDPQREVKSVKAKKVGILKPSGARAADAPAARKIMKTAAKPARKKKEPA